MKHNQQHKHYRFIFLCIIAMLLLAACSQSQSGSSKPAPPAHIEAIEGSDLHTVTLLPEAAKRIDIQTAKVVEEERMRRRSFGGEIIAGPSSSDGTLWVRVHLPAGDRDSIDASQPALVLPLAKSEGATGVTAKLLDSPPPAAKEKADDSALYYTLANVKTGAFAAGKRVRVELVLTSSGAKQLVIPYDSVIYDLNGQTWAYITSAPLTYIRQAIDIHYIDGDAAILNAGPPVGSEIVTDGAAELFGAEFGVGH